MLPFFKKDLLPYRINHFQVSVYTCPIKELIDSIYYSGGPDYEDLSPTDKKNIILEINGYMHNIITSQGYLGINNLGSEIQNIFNEEILSWLNDDENYHISEIENVVKAYYKTVDLIELFRKRPYYFKLSNKDKFICEIQFLDNIVIFLASVFLTKWRQGKGNCAKPPNIESFTWNNKVWLRHWKSRLAWVELWRLHTGEKPYNNIALSEKPGKLIDIFDGAVRDSFAQNIGLEECWKIYYTLDNFEGDNLIKKITLHSILETWGLDKETIKNLHKERMDKISELCDEYNKNVDKIASFKLAIPTILIPIGKRKKGHIQTVERILFDENQITYSKDTHTLTVYGDPYKLSPMQNAAFSILWNLFYDSKDDKKCEIHQDRLLEKIDSKAKRLRTIFRNSPLWGTIIVPGEIKGSHRLNFYKKNK